MPNFNSNARDPGDSQRIDPNNRNSWDPYEHPQTGLKAAIRNLRDTKMDTRGVVAPPPEAPETAPCPSCGGVLRPGEERCPQCHPEAGAAEVPRQVPEVARRGSSQAPGGAVYTLEIAMVCPHCRQSIQTVRVGRLLRTQVSFTSTLPRKGYVIACPECDRVLSAELSGMI